ncbi:MAG: UvrD-helicase domain-containing protein [Planctomycetaceae bacterium]|jgi:ATP-dependent exoDNAse (exonuclease V) beta subunit|nr:UvrD-helicase domain-containing protein [Planctomycetaceae bacterium]
MIPMDNTLIKASAGSGKTFRLSNRYLQLIFHGVAPDSILATTFTRKAAGEILDRVLLRLADAALDVQKREELAGFLEMELSEPMVLTALAKLAQNIHRLRISTLDSFFQQIAGTFHLELGMPPGWSMMEPDDHAPLMTEAVRLLLEQNAKDKIVELMHMLFKGETRTSVAGEISGLAVSLAEIYEESLPDAWHSLVRARERTPDEIRLLTARLSQAEIMQNKDGSPDKTTLNARNKDIDELRIEDTSKIHWETIGQRGICLKAARKEYVFSRKELTPSLIDVYEEIARQVRAFLINRLVSRTEAMAGLMEMLTGHLRHIKQQRRLFQFNDITNQLAKFGLEDRTVQLSHRTDFQTHHLLLDEFQDTSPNQWGVLLPFARQTVKRGSFFCVGDVKQAIYGWRGGVAAIFDSIEKDLGTLHKEHLETSYRSSAAVIETVNRLFGGIAGNETLADFPEAAAVWQKRFETHRTTKDFPGYCVLETSVLPPEPPDSSKNTDFHETDEADAKKGLTKQEYDAAHTEHVVERIKELHQRTPHASIGVLTRTNGMIQDIIRGLRQHNIEASEEGGNPLDISPAVELVLSALTLADHPGNRIVRFHLANSPLSELLNMKTANYNDDRNAQRVSHHIRHRLLYEGYFTVLRDWVRALAPYCDARDFRKLTQLLELASLHRSKMSIRTRDFVKFVRLQRVEDPSAANVRVMTIHRSKGLEFDIVVLPELDGPLQGRALQVVTHRKEATGPIETVFAYPSKEVQPYLPPRYQEITRETETRKVEESLCLLYVAMTRAVRELVLMIPPKPPASGKPKGIAFPKSMAGVLHAAFAPETFLDEKTVLYHYGDPRWFETLTPQEILKPETPSPKEPEPLWITLAAKSKSARRFHRVTPSERKGEDSADGMESTVTDAKVLFMTAGNSQAMNRGSAIHACFEHVEWLDQTPLNRKEVQRRIMPFLAEEPLRDKVVRDFFKMCEEPELRNALSFKTYQADMSGADAVRVLNERKFLTRIDRDTLQPGSIDRLVLLMKDGKPIRAEIFDFKTDHLDNTPEAVSQRLLFYQPQLTAYRKAVSQLYSLDLSAVTARIAFVSIGKVVTLKETDPPPAK